MKKVIIKTKAVEENKKCKEWDDNLLDEKNHISYVNMLYLNTEFDGSKKLQRELMKKLSNYKQQDKKRIDIMKISLFH